MHKTSYIFSCTFALLLILTIPNNAFSQNLGEADKNLSITNLQRYLIATNAGINANRLSSLGEPGIFDSYTQTALIEFQKSSKIYPANGYYSITTKQYVISNPQSDSMGSIVVSPSTTTPYIPQLILPPSNVRVGSIDISNWK